MRFNLNNKGISFSKPPIQEVVYSLQFEPLNKFNLGHLGLIWDLYRADYPNVEQDDPIAHEIERFGSVGVASARPNLQLFNRIPQPRIRLIQADGNSLIQAQNDHFVFNWRKHNSPDLEYPRYVNLKKQFESELDKYLRFIDSEKLGEPLINQVEVTNVNIIPADKRNFSDVFEGLSCGTDSSRDLTTESTMFQHRQVIMQDESPIGRLYTSIETTHLLKDGSKVFRVQFIGRAHPKKPNKIEALSTMDLLRDYINRSFVGLTTESMHAEWGQE